MTRKSIAVCFDLETTGADPKQDDFVQLSSVMFVEGDPSTAVVFDELAKPNRPIAQGAFDTQGISEERVAGKRPSSEVAGLWRQTVNEFAMLHDANVFFVGHNIVKFDVPIVAQHLPSWPQHRMIDTLWAARRLDPIASNHRLSHLVGERYVLDTELPKQAHDGLADCWMVGLLLSHYMKQTGQTLEGMATWLGAPQQLNLVPFGKHKGMPFSSLRPSSLKWFTQPDMDPDVRFTALSLLGGHYGQ